MDYELRITNELEEAVFMDQLHGRRGSSAGYGSLSKRRTYCSTTAIQDLLATRRSPARGAIDEHGHDVLSRIARLDREYPDDFNSNRFAATQRITS